MNKREKEVIQLQLKAEEDIIHELEKQYRTSLNEINQKVKLFEYDIEMLDEAINAEGMDDASRAVLQSQKRAKVYQKQYQEALEGQISGILDRMQGNNYSTIESYLKQSYEDAFIGTMYDIHGQGIPLIMPIDQAAAVKAIMTDSKISKGLYNALGVDVKGLKKAIRLEITRGIASSLSYNVIARNISNTAKAPLSRAKTIVRTEGHRIQQQSADDARRGAISRGCDVVKQWDATLDGNTRPNHRMLDGQIREEDEPFEVAGMKAMFPGEFGDPAEDCNCRCVALTRARWALDEEELKTLRDRAEYFGLTKAKAETFEEYKGKYLKAVEESEYLRNNLPKNYEDTRNIGSPISQEELNKFLNFAESKGIQIGSGGTNTGGFDAYCGDVKVLNEIVEEMAAQINSKLFKRSEASKVILVYDNVLGYKGDRSKIDIGAFAETKGHTIMLNKFMFDDSKFLAKEYAEAVEAGLFVKGTTYINIADHEMGHIIEKNTHGLYNKLLSVFEKEAETQGVTVRQYLKSNISVYAADQNIEGKYHELFPEINSLLHSGNESAIVELLKKEGVI